MQARIWGHCNDHSEARREGMGFQEALDRVEEARNATSNLTLE